ncbi:hypothetical protein G4228_005191 [Cervus hanglu yarkandensis]|nr:hypothetical protein G4228_005191 [Cervus hanglu yarkandensis]
MGAPFPPCSGEKSHDDYVLIYKPETEGDRDHTPDTSFLGLTTKMLTVKGLEGINACYRSEQLEKMAFFQCVEEVEKCFLEESSGEQDSRSGKSQPENILCVNRDTKQIKIIDFGLARRYKPREKLKVNFGTPEFLAPEVVNYDFVSFPTDMWSVGVITYMLLSGLSPFLGDDDAETLNNILACRWDLEDQEFQDVSEEAREFISKLLIKEKSWRISASEALKHPWLSDHKLHSRLRTQVNTAAVFPLLF